MTKPKTAAIYARFSSDRQNDRSIGDQVSLCKTYAKREHFEVVQEFSDRAKSGATLFERDGLLELMTAAKARKFDAIIVESLDRLSRDTEDLAGLFKKLTFFGIDLRTVNEGATTDIHVGIRGIVGSIFLKDLGNKVKRHHHGRVREGDIMGAAPYGYRSIPDKPGKYEIDPERAAIVQRVFAEYADGRSPRAIASGLTRDKIPCGAAVWSHQSLHGGGGKCGMLKKKNILGGTSTGHITPSGTRKAAL